MSAVLAAACGLMIAAALRELWAERGEGARTLAARRLRALSGRLPRSGAAGVEQAGLSARLRRAGLTDRLTPRAVFAARAACVAAAGPLALIVSPVAPGRVGILVAVGVPASAALIPDLAIERLARRRRARISARLPDSLELIAVGAGAGGNAAMLLREAGQAVSGPLREELAITLAELECGVRASVALRGLGSRSGSELAGLAILLERSRRLGSPLSAGLQRQAATLREDYARQVEERAARAAPKIQLVIALLLVPSVLLLVAAAILANADALLTGF